MDDLKTYNRVKSLESRKMHTFLSTCYISLILIAIGSLASLIFYENAWMYSVAAMVCAIALSCLIYLIDNHREKHCQFCRNTLSYITRPFLLKGKYLSIPGKKEGDYFYTRCSWGVMPFQKRWAKISNRSLACHHCRLTEEGHSEYIEAVSAEELSKVGKLES